MRKFTVSVDLVPYEAVQEDNITVVVKGLGRNDCFKLLDEDLIKSKTRFYDNFNGIPIMDNFCWVTVSGEDVRFELAHPDYDNNEPWNVIEEAVHYVLDAAPSIGYETLSSYNKWVNS